METEQTIPDNTDNSRSRGLQRSADPKTSAVDRLLADPTFHPLHSVFPRSTKVGKALAVYSLGLYAYKGYKTADDYIKKRKHKSEESPKFSLVFDSSKDEEIHAFVMRMVFDQIDYDSIKNFTVDSYWDNNEALDVPYRVPMASSTHMVMIGGHHVSVIFNEESSEDDKVRAASAHYVPKSTITFKAFSKEVIDDVFNKILDSYLNKFKESDDCNDEALRPRRAFYWTGSSWQPKMYSPRLRESVILRNGDREMLFDDLERFRSLKNDYLRINVPWHRGYLLYGPPGTGKTSTAIAIGSYFDDMQLFVMSLAQVKTDADLIRAVSEMSVNSVLVLEDIDVVSSTHSREESGHTSHGLTLDGLLNVLDGFNTPNGLVTIMTTNYLEKLDPALIRPGRVDLQVEVGFIDDDQLFRMVNWYLSDYSGEITLPRVASDITPATIVGCVKDFIGYPEKILAEITRVVEESNQKCLQEASN